MVTNIEQIIKYNIINEIIVVIRFLVLSKELQLRFITLKIIKDR